MEVVADQQDQAVEAKQGKIKITVCLSLSGIAEGGEEVYAEFQKQIAEMELSEMTRHDQIKNDLKFTFLYLYAI